MAKIRAGSNEDHQGRWSWIRDAGGFLSMPGNLFLNRETRDRGGSANRSGVGTSAAFGLQRRSLMFGVILLAIMAALVGSLIAAPRGLSNPPPAFAQPELEPVCAEPDLGLQTSPGILYITASLYPRVIWMNEVDVLADPNNVEPIYRDTLAATEPQYQIVAAGEAFDDTAPWIPFWFGIRTISGETGLYELELAPLSHWKVRARTLCDSGDYSTVIEATIQVEKFRPFTMSLTLNGTAVYSLKEGQTGTLTMTLVNAGDVFDRDVDYQLDLKTNPLIYPEEENPIKPGEVTVTGGKAGNVSTLVAGQRSVTWTLLAVQDNLVNDPNDATDANGESAVEWAYPFIWTLDTVDIENESIVENGGLVQAPGSWGGNIHILDVDPSRTVPTAILPGNTPAQGQLLIGTLFPENEPITPEIHDVLCGNVVPLLEEFTIDVADTYVSAWQEDAEGNITPLTYYAIGEKVNISLPIDADGEPIGGFGYRYEWTRHGAGGGVIDGVTGECFKVTVDDIGYSFSAKVTFEDRLLNTETFSSVGTTGVVVSGARLVAANGFYFGEPLTVDLTTMTYAYCHTACNTLQSLPSSHAYPRGTTVAYQWIHVDAYGNRVFDREERVVTDTNSDGVIDENDTPQLVIVGGAYSPGWATNTYIPTERWDAGHHLQVKITFSADSGEVDRNGNKIIITATRWANVQTPVITNNRTVVLQQEPDRGSDDEVTIDGAVSDAEESVTIPDQFDDTLLETIPTNLSAWLPNLGGGVGLRWSATVGSQAGSGFEYRFKPVVVADTGFSTWQAAPGGTDARTVTVPNLINNVEYLFEVRSIGSSGSEATETHTIVYQHRVRDCTV